MVVFVKRINDEPKVRKQLKNLLLWTSVSMYMEEGKGEEGEMS